MKALVGVDGWDISFDAIAQACGILNPEKDRLVLYFSPPRIRHDLAVDYDVISRGLADLTESILNRAVFHLPGAWKRRVERIVGHGDPASEILDTAKQVDADLIVVGTHGLGSLGRLLLGSVSRKVVRVSTIPVLVARKRAPESQTFGQRVVLACESFASGKELSGALKRFSWPSGAVVEVVHVVPSAFGGAIPDWLDAEARKPNVDEMVKQWVRHHDQRIAQARKEMELLRSELPAGLRPMPPSVVEGSPADEIVKAARRQQSDLILIGAKSSTTLGRLAGGSTCEAVLNHAPCSVLVVHHSHNALVSDRNGLHSFASAPATASR